MNPAALLKTIIYLTASSLLYPVLFALVAITFWVLLISGAFFAEWLERARLEKCPACRLPDLIRSRGCGGIFPHRVRLYLKELAEVVDLKGKDAECEIENLLQEKRLKMLKELDRTRVLIRAAPALGLIGTLIPMGTGLAALGQGDMTRLSSDLVLAFTTTVVGLATGIAAYFFHTIKSRWAEEDFKNMELIAEMFTSEEHDQGRMAWKKADGNE